MGIIYLIQPVELIGTNRYKIGCSRKDTLERVNTGYKKGTLCISIHQCNNPIIVEKELKARFSREFALIAGTEYFEGDKNKMKKCFMQIANNDDTLSILANRDDPVSRNMINLEIVKRKIDYMANVDFGGNKFHIWFHINDNEADIARGVLFKIAYLDASLDGIDFAEITIYDTDCINHTYIDKLINNKIIQNAINYDLHDASFVAKLYKNKEHYDVLIEDDYIICKNYSKSTRIMREIVCDAILNNTIYCITHTVADNSMIFYINGKRKTFKLHNGKWKSVQYIQKNEPYIKETNVDTGEVCYLNSSYEYIGHGAVNPYGWTNVERTPVK